MTAGGWISMILSVGFVTVFFGWTLYLVMSRKEEDTEHIHSTMDETPDMEIELPDSGD